MKKVFFMLFVAPFLANAGVLDEDIAVRLAAKNIVVVKEMNKAFIQEPSYVFEKDFGYGLEVLPHAGGYGEVFDYMCKSLGYKDYYSLDGSRENKNAYSMDLYNGKLTLVKTTTKTTYQSVVCDIQ